MSSFGPLAGVRYGLLGLPLAFVALPLYVLLPNLYARTFGVPLATLGAVLLGHVSRGPELESALRETANIVASACLSAIGKLTRWKLLPTVPDLHRGTAREVVSAALRETEGVQTSPVVVLEARFSAASGATSPRRSCGSPASSTRASRTARSPRSST